jgi:hypothetical protein
LVPHADLQLLLRGGIVKVATKNIEGSLLAQMKAKQNVQYVKTQI